jgi:hypothetical protein
VADSNGSERRFDINAAGCSFVFESTGERWNEALEGLARRWSAEEPGPSVGVARFGCELGPRPDRPPDISDHETFGWTSGIPRFVIGPTEIALPDPTTVLIQGDNPRQALHDSLSIILGWLLAPLNRWTVHGAAPLPHGGDIGVLALGHSGTGKSTTAGSAVMAGWPVLGDDMVIMRTDTPVPQIRGVQHQMILPGEFEPVLGVDTEAARDARGRRVLDAQIPSGWFQLGAIAVLAHGHEPRTSIEVASPVDAIKMLWTAYFMAVVPTHLERWFPVASQLCKTLPLWKVKLGSDTRLRLSSTAEAFEAIISKVGVS